MNISHKEYKLTCLTLINSTVPDPRTILQTEIGTRITMKPKQLATLQQEPAWLQGIETL